MVSIAEESAIISNRLQEKYLELKSELRIVNDDITMKAKEFKAAAAQGDHRENAAYSQTKEDLAKLNTKKIYILQDIELIESLPPDMIYVPKTYISLYSTFRLERDDTKEVTTWKVYPGPISDIERGIMSSECQVYEHLAGKEKGDSIYLVNRVNGAKVKYNILEVY